MQYIQAIEDKIVAKIIQEDNNKEVISSGGLIMPSGTVDRVVDYGIVISVGEKVTNIKPGDTIVAIKQKGAFVEINQNTGILDITKAYFLTEIIGVMKEVEVNA